MQEVEVKILEVNKEKVIDTLTKLKAEKIFDDEIVTLFLDFQDCRIHKRQDVLRVRREGAATDLTYKKIKRTPSAKIAEEYSIEISDLEAALNIFRNIGLSVTQKMKKHRLSYKIGSVRFDIDSYMEEFGFIPDFLEIEGSEDKIKMYAGMLGFQEKDCLPWSTDELIAYYMNKKGLDNR